VLYLRPLEAYVSGLRARLALVVAMFGECCAVSRVRTGWR